MLRSAEALELEEPPPQPAVTRRSRSMSSARLISPSNTPPARAVTELSTLVWTELVAAAAEEVVALPQARRSIDQRGHVFGVRRALLGYDAVDHRRRNQLEDDLDGRRGV